MKSKPMKKASAKKITAREFDRLADEGGEALHSHIEWGKGKVSAPKVRRVNVEFPEWVIRRLDDEATRRGITRQALIKTLIYDKVKPAA